MSTLEWARVRHVLATTVALINSGPPAEGAEGIDGVGALRTFIADHVITEVEQPTAKDVSDVLKVRASLRSVFVVPDSAARVGVVNRLLARARITPRLLSHDGLGMHFHYFPPYSTLADHLLADCTMALATLISLGEEVRLRVCAAPDCEHVMIDESRNRSRLFCDSGRCGNRVNVSAYRERQRKLMGRASP